MDEDDAVRGAGSDEYRLMQTLERLESLREDLEDLGYSSLQELEGVLGMTAAERMINGSSPAPAPQVVGGVDRAQIATLRNDMLDLGVANMDEITGAIDDLNTRLDALDDGDAAG